MVKVKFKYRRAWSNDWWKYKTVEAYTVYEVINMYSLGIAYDYSILSVKEI